MGQQTEWEQPQGKSKRKMKPRNRVKGPNLIKQNDTEYSGPLRKQGKRKNTGKYNPAKDTANFPTSRMGISYGAVQGGGQYWAADCASYQNHDGLANTAFCWDPAQNFRAQDDYAYYQPNIWYEYSQNDSYAAQTSEVTATRGSRLRAEAPEFIPTGHLFSFVNIDDTTRVNTPIQTEYAAMMDNVTDQPTQRRYVTF